jgi:serine/threonine-protein phosphatase 2A regulatory subunit A
MLAERFVELAKAVGQDIVREDLVQAFVQLLGDAEAEVKTAAAGQIPGSWGPHCADMRFYPRISVR